MTKYFKLLGVALLATTLCFTSCTKDPEGNDPGTENPEPGTGDNPDPGTGGGGNTIPSAGNGEFVVKFEANTWTAAEMVVGYLSQYNAVVVNAYSDPQGKFPLMEMTSYAPANMIGTINSGDFDATTQEYAGGELVYFFYYNETLLFSDANGNNAYDEGEDTFGDWWAKNATINIQALDLTNMTATATCTAVMFDALAVLVQGAPYATAPTANLAFNANNVELQVAKNAEMPKAIKVQNISVR